MMNGACSDQTGSPRTSQHTMAQSGPLSLCFFSSVQGCRVHVMDLLGSDFCFEGGEVIK